MERMKVVSLLPSATELVCAAGGEAMLVGRSHECDHPPSIRDRAILTAAINKFESCKQMNDAVVASLAAGQGLYTVDSDLMQQLRPNVIVTQSLCEVCSVDLRLVEKLCGDMQPRPQIISLNPLTLEEVLQDLLRVGEALGLRGTAAAAVAALQARVDAARAFVASQPTLKLDNVAMLEWFDPFFPGGHWTPQLVAMAGARHPLNPDRDGRGGPPSRAITVESVVESDPDWIIICPCGLDLQETHKELPAIIHSTWWRQLRAVREGRVVLVDGNQMFNRPGPRLVEALEFLVGLLHERHDLIPQGFPWEHWVQPEEVEQQQQQQQKEEEEGEKEAEGAAAGKGGAGAGAAVEVTAAGMAAAAGAVATPAAAVQV